MRINGFISIALAAVIFTVPALFAGAVGKTAEGAPESTVKSDDKGTQAVAQSAALKTTERKESNTREESICVLNVKSGENFTVNLEEYLCGVVIAEMPSDFAPEALKAQAIAARSYAAYRIFGGGESRHGGGAVLCTSYACCKAYISYEEATERWGADTVSQKWEIIKAAVYGTAGKIITYNGEVCDAVFHSSSDGYTENACDLWGYEIPYLVSVESPEEAESREAVFSAEEIKKITGQENIALGEICLDSSGRTASVTIGDKTYSGREMRELFSLRSTKFELVSDENGGYKFTTHGYGHGVGMSQYGADAMAKSGAGSEEILRHYYTGVEITDISSISV